LDEDAIGAIDDFMKSPKAGRRSVMPSQVLTRSSTAKDLKPNQGNKKTGIVVSKSYHMLCGNCGKRFSSKYNIYLIV
jgi:hypothetical protein